MSERRMHPDGFMCLVCQVRTKNEGQLCSACVDKGHRVENDTLLMNLSFYTVPTPGTTLTLIQPVPDDPFADFATRQAIAETPTTGSARAEEDDRE